MPSYADLEIAVQRWDAEQYAVEMRFSQPGSDAESRPPGLAPNLIRLNRAALEAQAANSAEYGRVLTGFLFGNEAVARMFARARQSAASHQDKPPLRFRLFIGDEVPELNSLCWETLRDPDDPAKPLLLGDNIYFSRYAASADFRPVLPLAQDQLKALVVVANPTDLHQYQPNGRPLAPFDVAGEMARAQKNLAPLPVTTLEQNAKATLANISDKLQEGYDILYLACHGALLRDGPKLWLESDDGASDRVSGNDFVQRLQELRHQPRLVVLASCQSAGAGEPDATWTALGPRLAEAGIPAVLAMQGNVSLDTIAAFMPKFFQELQQDGQVDRAVALARGAVRERPDSWMPVLYMRLKSGRVWQAPGFGRAGFDRWEALLSNLENKRCVPILGSGLLDFLFGSVREVAQGWGKSQLVPFAHDRLSDMPRVAQYLAVQQDIAFPRSELRRYMCRVLLKRYGAQLPAEANQYNLGQLFSAVAKLRRQEPGALDPYQLLARLPCALYMTTNPDDLLADALHAANKPPTIQVCPWNKELGQESNDELQAFYRKYQYDKNSPFAPQAENPLVYHLFGRYECEDSLVLKEDDFFDYPLGVAVIKELIPPLVRHALANKALMFLGFHLDSWGFRVLFRYLRSQGGRELLGRYAHVAVQIDPQESYIVEPELARRYLERYFQSAANISIYWGTMDEFLRELQEQWRLRYGSNL